MMKVKSLHLHPITEPSQTLRWDLTPPTPNFWLNFYMQNACKIYNEFRDDKRRSWDMRPLFKLKYFKEAMNLIDVAVHNIESLTFCSSILAAAAFATATVPHVSQRKRGFSNGRWSLICCINSQHFSYRNAPVFHCRLSMNVLNGSVSLGKFPQNVKCKILTSTKRICTTFSPIIHMLCSQWYRLHCTNCELLALYRACSLPMKRRRTNAPTHIYI